MEAILARLWSISVQAAAAFCILFAVRGLFTLCRVPKKYAYALWAILFLRLLLPVQLESALGFMPSGDSIMEAAASLGSAVASRVSVTDGEGSRQAGQQGQLSVAVEAVPAQDGNQETDPGRAADSAGPKTAGEKTVLTEIQAGQEDSAEARDTVGSASLLFGLWLSGIGVLFLYSAVSYGRLKKKLRCSMVLRGEEGFAENICLADEIDTPFVMGLTAPKIYLPSSMKKENLPYVIVHEQIHIARRDYLIKMAAYAVTCVYWFHPLVWLGFVLMCRDMEMSCDEAAVKRLGEDSRSAYAESLLLLSCKTSRLAGAPLAFGEGNTEGRIKYIMKHKRPLAAAAVAAVFLIGLLAAGLLTGPQEEFVEEAGGAGKQFRVEPVPKAEVSDTVLEAPAPVISLSDTLGTEGPVLDYAKDGIVVFHGYFGLYVYSEAQGRVIGSVDLQAIGCGDTQGDNYCEIYVAEDGSAVYLHPLGNYRPCSRTGKGGREETGISDFGYVYDVEKAQLSKMEYSLFGSSNETSSEIFQSMTGAALFDAGKLEQTESIPLCANGLGMGVQSYQCSVTKGEDAVTYGYLESVDGTVEGLVYIEKRENKDGSLEARCVRLFGGEPLGSSTVTYGSGTEITIDGVSYEMTERKSSINAITGIQYADGFWIVEGHIDPTTNAYSLYDTQRSAWEPDIFGTCLTWEKLEGAPLGDSLRKTAIYAQEYAICEYSLRIMAWVSREYMEQGEYIRQLVRNGDTILIRIQTLEGGIRELSFSYSQWREQGGMLIPRPVE